MGVSGMLKYFDKIVRGTEQEDSRVIIQSLKGMIGKNFTLLNYYKEIPVSYDAKLLSVENEMAEFQVHEYQAKVINLERTVMIQSHSTKAFPDDICGEAFYVNSAKKRVIICRFAYAKIRSSLRRFVRVRLDRQIQAELMYEGQFLSGNVKDISLGGAAIVFDSNDILVPGSEVNLSLKLPDGSGDAITEVGVIATVVDVFGDEAPFTCILEFHPEKHSQQQIAYFINQRQVEIIKELKELVD
jgi:hypothetical protein